MQNSKLCIGTAQFGQNYGITNEETAVDAEEAKRILEIAKRNQINTIDTAQGYGESENIIGQCGSLTRDFNIITKLKNIEVENYSDQRLKNELDQMLNRSMKRLKKQELDGLLIHNPETMKGEIGQNISEWLKQKKTKGYIKKIGISIYEQGDIDESILNWVDLVQAPFSIYDQRIMNKRGKLFDKIKSGKIELHVRSIYLQGIVLQEKKSLPGFLSSDFTNHHEKLIRYAKDRGLTNMDIAHRFIQEEDSISKVIVGVASKKQLEEIIASWNRMRDTEERITGEWGWVIKSDIDPRFWQIERKDDKV